LCSRPEGEQEHHHALVQAKHHQSNSTVPPALLQCGTLTQLARFEPAGEPDHDLRTFECITCGNADAVIDRARAVITPGECIKQAHECSHKARQNGVIQGQRDVLYAMSRTWDTLARQTARLGALQAAQGKQPAL
jgi:hypothetical protein